MEMNVLFGNGESQKLLHLKNVQLLPQKRPEHTYLFLLCTKKKFVDGFLKKGTIKFTRIADWKPDGTSRGDDHECVFATARTSDLNTIQCIAALRDNSFATCENGVLFFRSREALDMRALCLFGLNENIMRMREKVSQDHRFHQGGYVPQEYFHNLFPDWDRNRYALCDGEDKPYLLIIKPDEFYQRVINGLLSYGVRSEEILVSPVSYHDLYGPTYIIGHEWDEVFTKDEKYRDQNEVRFVIDTRRAELKERLDIIDGVLDLGSMEDIALASPFYFEDMQCEIRDDKLLYSLAEPVTQDVSFVDFVAIIVQTLSDELPTSPSNIADLEQTLRDCVGWMHKRYPNAQYDFANNTVVVSKEDGSTLTYECWEPAKNKLLSHYYNYVERGDDTGANKTKEIFEHFFGHWPIVG